MKSILFIFLLCTLISSCSPELDREKALTIFKQAFPIDTSWQYRKLELRTWDNYSRLIQKGVLQQLPPDQDNSGFFSGGVAVAIIDDRPKYQLTDLGKNYSTPWFVSAK